MAPAAPVAGQQPQPQQAIKAASDSVMPYHAIPTITITTAS